VQDGPLTSRLQKLQVGDELLVGTKPVGTLITDNLLPGKNLYLLSTGTGLAPFMSIIKDLDVYEQYDKVILTHGVRWGSELAYQQRIENELPNNEYFGEVVREKLIYYPTVTREPFRNNGRLTDAITSGKLTRDIGLPDLNPETDRFMLCGSPAMLDDLTSILDSTGYREARGGQAGHYVIERALVASEPVTPTPELTRPVVGKVGSWPVVTATGLFCGWWLNAGINSACFCLWSLECRKTGA